MILVTGSRGVVGQPLCKFLKAKSKAFVSVSRAKNKHDRGLQWNLNRAAEQAQREVLSNCDVLIHCAPIWLLPQHLPELLSAGITQMVVFSSTSVISKRESKNLEDQHLVKSLADAEQELLLFAETNKIDLTILRPSMIYGYGLDENITHIAKRLGKLKVMPLAGSGRGLRQPVHADDLVMAAVAALNRQTTGVKSYNLGGGETLSYRAMVEKIFLALDMRPRFISLPPSLYRLMLKLAGVFASFNYTASMADRMNLDLVYDSSDAVRDLNFQPQPFLVNPSRDLPR